MNRSEIVKLLCLLYVTAFLQQETSSTDVCQPGSVCTTLVPTLMLRQTASGILSTIPHSSSITISKTASHVASFTVVSSSAVGQTTQTRKNVASTSSTNLSLSGTQSPSSSCLSDPLGIARGEILDSAITSSTALNSNSYAHNARLGNNKAWIPDSSDKFPWIEVNLQQMKNITGIVTQGYQGSYITQYYVSYSYYGNYWRNHTVQGAVKVFQANTNDTVVKSVALNPSITAQFIRLHPVKCISRCALRMELYGCNVTAGFPGQPTGLIASKTDSHQISISWKAPSDSGGSTINGYVVKWKVDGQASHQQKIVSGRQQTAAYFNTSPYTLYEIQVQAYNSKGGGPWSTPLRVKSAESIPSAKPGNFKVTSTSSLALDVTWQAIPADKENGRLLGYRIYYKKALSLKENTKEVGPEVVAYKLTGLEYVEYSVRMAAFNSKGSGQVTQSQKQVPMEGAPSPPRNLQLQVLSSISIKATWTAPEKMNGVFRRYVVRYGTARSKLNDVKISLQTELELSGLEEYTEYFVLVLAETSVTGNPSAIQRATTREAAPSASPEINVKDTVAEDAHTIRVKWNDIKKEDQNGVIQGYKVFYSVKGQGIQQSITVSSDQHNTLLITGLNPYTQYCIKVVGFTKEGSSPSGRCHFVRTSEAGPSEPQNVVVHVLSSSSLSVKWKEPAFTHGLIKSYTIFFGLTKDDFSKQDVTGNTLEAVVIGLMKFTTYFIKVRGTTSLPGNSSTVVNATTLEDKPSAPVSFRGQAVSAVDILLSWYKPLEANGIIRYYYIRTYDSQTGQVGNLFNKSSSHHHSPGIGWSHLISNLKPFRNYTFTIQAVTVSPGDLANCSVMTLEGEPSGPRDVTAVLLGGDMVVTWKDPEDHNGILVKYIVYYDGKRTYDSSFQDKGELVLSKSDRKAVIAKDKLKPGTEYTVYVKAATKKGTGESSNNFVVQTPSIAPPPPDDPHVSDGDVNPTTITIHLKPSPQSNGEVIVHQVILEKLGKVSKRETKPLPAEIHGYKVAQEKGEQYYVAAEFERPRFPREFVLGDGKMYGGYHNAPLQPETKYRVYVRGVAETDDGERIYGEAAAVRLPPTGVEPVVKASDHHVGIIAGIVGALVLLVIGVVAFVLYRRSNRPLNANLDVENQKRKRGEFELRRLGVRKKLLAVPGEQNNEPELPPIPIDQFAKHVAKLHKSDDRGFMIEYNKLDSGREYACESAFLPESKNKNRYGNIAPYDHSRVVLSTVEGAVGTDYINASRVDGYNKPNAYIATQGPVPPTFGDFWRMVWEQQSSTIVMLTNLQERHKLKCHKYWPDETEEYGDISVTLVRSEHYSDYKIRTFTVKRESEKEERQVKQFHFTVWPDHGVPEYATALLAFRRRIRAYNPADAGPKIVHCSAGVGRTGTYMVIDSMLDRIKAENSVDIFNYVAYMRTRRIAMVQTEEQYTFCHDAILESVQCGNTQIYAHDLRITLARMDEVSKDTKVTRFESEFKTLNKVSPALQKGCYMVASYPENREKNRFQDILASDCSRVVLTAIDDNEASSYINAVHISGYKQQHAFIVTQYPLTPTVTDFWRMLCEQDSCCVVLFHSKKEEGDFPQFWPKTDTATYDDLITVQCLSANSSSVDNLKTEFDQSEITEKMVKATDLRTPEKSSRIKMFMYSGWADENEAPSCSALITLIAKVEKWQQHSGNGPITVVCSDGLGRSGTFCALYSVIERLKIEQVVDVFQAIKAMRIPRPGLVKTLKEYRFIHYAVQEYLSAFDDYANFKA